MDAEALDGRTGLELVHQVGLPQQGTAHGHELESFGHGPVDGVEAVDAAEEDERHGQRLAELAGVGQEVGLLERVLGEEALAEQAEAEADGPGHRGGHLADRGLAAEQVHGVLEGAATGELDGVEAAVGLEHAGDLHALVDPEAARAIE